MIIVGQTRSSQSWLGKSLIFASQPKATWCSKKNAPASVTRALVHAPTDLLLVSWSVPSGKSCRAGVFTRRVFRGFVSDCQITTKYAALQVIRKAQTGN